MVNVKILHRVNNDDGAFPMPLLHCIGNGMDNILNQMEDSPKPAFPA
jgi:hypothetical protein